ncbi:MAG: undecaprenyl/decaprenyl-phosphate alpha-N-acetylglucosaminyl 1-phosphate transferase [Armatimonadetes bacterium]|nr:MAG: undecaprenyl/decaprenyl-phosphate alpha-N-acetylglucosaminyl 1-phosphate transferase [Armatimonadota bacterium]
MNLLVVFTVSFFITVLITPLVIMLAKKYGLVDDPKNRPHPAHIQKRIIPRAGGLPVYIAIVITTLIFLPLEKYLVGIFFGITTLLILGLIDDKRLQFNPYKRLLLLFAAAGFAVASGVGISFINNPLASLTFLPSFLTIPIIHLDTLIYSINLFGEHNLILIADIFAFFWIITLTQIINWSKGVDGQMPSITLVTAIILGLLSMKFYFLGDANQLNIAILAFIVAGASAGLLIFNWYPSKIIPGFSGSTVLAYMLAVLAILSGAKLATALLVLAIPTIDFIYTFWRRVLTGHSPVWGDRGHLHHRLLDLGWSHQKISLFYMFGSVILGSVALAVNTGSKIFAVSIVGVAFIAFILWLNSFYHRD